MNIDDYREEIDSIDRELVSLIDRRMDVAGEIAKYKMSNNLPITDYLREKKLIEKILSMSRDDMAMYNKIVFSNLIEVSKDYQRKITNKDSRLVEEIRRALESDKKTIEPRSSVAFCGISGAYAEEACERLIPLPQITYTKNFKGVFAAIDSGMCKYGILPIENSTAGSVNQVYDLMKDYNFHIVKSLKLRVDHSLVGVAGAKVSQIREIYSHQQAISQCEDFIKSLGEPKIVVCENTAMAARKVAELKREDVAAIASYNSAKLYGLQCLEEAIQDNDNNYTRFICITKDLEILPGANKTSIMMVVDHKPGALYNILSRFNSMGINLVKLESRPLAKREFEFMFYFDIECSVYSKEFSRIVGQLEEMSREFKYLGSYIEE